MMRGFTSEEREWFTFLRLPGMPRDTATHDPAHIAHTHTAHTAWPPREGEVVEKEQTEEVSVGGGENEEEVRGCDEGNTGDVHVQADVSDCEMLSENEDKVSTVESSLSGVGGSDNEAASSRSEIELPSFQMEEMYSLLLRHSSTGPPSVSGDAECLSYLERSLSPFISEF